MLHQCRSLSTLCKKSQGCIQPAPDPTVAAQTPVSLVPSCQLVPKHTPRQDSAKLVPSACVLNIGKTSESKLDAVTCLCKLSPASPQPLSRTQCCSTSDRAKSHPSPNPHGAHPLLMMFFVDLPSSQTLLSKRESVAKFPWPTSIWRWTT